MPRVDAKSYYNLLPPIDHECGDIWRGLPSFGMLGGKPCRGLVVTPACDLSWQKSETVTYLPIIPIRTFFALDVALPIVIEKVSSALQQLDLDIPLSWSAKAYMTPLEEELSFLNLTLQRYLSAKQRSQKDLKAVARIEAGINIVNAIRSTRVKSIETDNLKALFLNDWEKTKEKIIKNNFSPATHFLPRDNQLEIFSGVYEHSIIMFRYPITIPLRLLHHAQEVPEREWKAFVSKLNLPAVLKNECKRCRPVKMLSLKSAFLSDVLTRFSALYNRIGSPDFTNETVSLYSSEVD